MKSEFISWYYYKHFEFVTRWDTEIKFGDPKKALEYLREANTYKQAIKFAESRVD